MNRVWPEPGPPRSPAARFGSKGCRRCVRPFAASCVIPLRPAPSLHHLVSFDGFIGTMGQSDFRPRLAVSSGYPSLAAPAGDQSGGPGRISQVPTRCPSHVMWPQTPAERCRLSHSDDAHVAFAGRNGTRPPQHRTFRGSIPHPTQLAVYASDPALPRRPQDSLPACLLGFDRMGLAPASSYQLSYRTPHRAPVEGRTRPAFGAWAAHPVPVRGLRPSGTCQFRHCVRGMRWSLPFLRPTAFPPRSPPPACRPVLFEASSVLYGRPTPHTFRSGFGSSPFRSGPGSPWRLRAA